MIWLILSIILVLCAIAASAGWVGGSGTARNALWSLALERDAACAERDRALERIATYGGVIEAYEEKIRKLKDEAQVTISDLEVQIVQRDEQIARQRTQLAEVQYVKLDTPKRPARKAANASNVTGSEATA